MCTTSSPVQMRAIRDALDREPTLPSASPTQFEGDAADGCLLSDFGGVVIHVFSEEARAYYQLDELWAEASVIARLQ